MSTPKTKTITMAMITTTVTPRIVATVSAGASSEIMDTLGSAVDSDMVSRNRMKCTIHSNMLLPTSAKRKIST